MFEVTDITTVENDTALGLDGEGRTQVCLALQLELIRLRDAEWNKTGRREAIWAWYSYRDEIKDWSLVTSDGKLSTRISKMVRELHSLTLDDKAMSAIGGAIAAHSFKQQIIYDVTDQFDWDDGDFGDSGSCFWGSNSAARDALRDNGALALRFYKKTVRDWRPYQGIGRCWVVPRPHGYVLFNAYGPELEAVRERVRVIYPNVECKMVRLSNEQSWSGLVYINRNLGLFVTQTPDKEKNLLGHKDTEFKMDLKIDTAPYRGQLCSCCGYREEEGRYIDYDEDEWVCDSCYHDHYFSCFSCGQVEHNNNRTTLTAWVRNWRRIETLEIELCDSCACDNYTECDECGNSVNHNDAYVYLEEIDGNDVCSQCINDHYRRCDSCDEYYDTNTTKGCKGCQLELELEEVEV